MVVFDLTSRESFESVQKWLVALEEYPQRMNCVIGNKSDLPEMRAVELTEIEQFCDALQVKYGEVSALTG